MNIFSKLICFFIGHRNDILFKKERRVWVKKINGDRVFEKRVFDCAGCSRCRRSICLNIHICPKGCLDSWGEVRL